MVEVKAVFAFPRTITGLVAALFFTIGRAAGFFAAIGFALATTFFAGFFAGFLAAGFLAIFFGATFFFGPDFDFALFFAGTG